MDYCGPKGIPLHEFLAWPQESQDAALAWSVSEGTRCTSCGTHAEDWANRSTPQHWHEQVCPGCRAKQRAAQQMQADKDGTRGLHLVAAAGSAHDCPICNP